MADLAMVLGAGFAPFRGGPLAFAESIGQSVLGKNLQALQESYGARFRMPESAPVQDTTDIRRPLTESAANSAASSGSSSDGR